MARERDAVDRRTVSASRRLTDESLAVRQVRVHEAHLQVLREAKAEERVALGRRERTRPERHDGHAVTVAHPVDQLGAILVQSAGSRIEHPRRDEPLDVASRAPTLTPPPARVVRAQPRGAR